MKSVGIMQPYFLPYIGYFQLINMVDEFVLYDNIEFTKKGWINRNRMLQQGKDEYFSLSIKKDSDYLDVNQRFLADSFQKDKIKLLNKIRNNYQKAPYFKDAYPLIEEIYDCSEHNLFEFIYHSLNKVLRYLSIETPIIVSSSLEIDQTLKGKDKVIALTKAVGGTRYINPIGGKLLYDKNEFSDAGLELKFFQTLNFEYPQLGNEFIPFLSILDVMMFNSPSQIKSFLMEFEIL